MKELKGIAVSPGITIGKAYVLRSEDTFALQPKTVAEDDIPREIARFEDALTRTRAEILGIQKNSPTRSAASIPTFSMPIF